MADQEEYEGGDFVEQQEGGDDAKILQQCKDRETQVTNQINMGKIAEALSISLKDPPLSSKETPAKELNGKTVLAVLAAAKDADITKLAQGLTEEEVDILMKYIYKGLAACADSAKLLKWHEAAFAQGGYGCIVRVMGSRLTV